MQGPLLPNHTHKFDIDSFGDIVCVYCDVWVARGAMEVAARQNIRLKGTAVTSPEAQAFFNRLVDEANNKHS